MDRRWRSSGSRMRRRSSSSVTPTARSRRATLTLGKPTVAKLALGGDSFPARRLDVPQLIRLADAPPAEPVAGGSARAIFALVELAQRSVAEGLVHPYLDHGGGWWHAFWGATLDAERADDAHPDRRGAARRRPRRASTATGTPPSTTSIRCSSTRSRAIACALTACGLRARRSRSARPRVDLFLDGLAAADPVLPPHPGYSALDRKLSRLGRRRARPADVDAAGGSACTSTSGTATGSSLELWLQAEDDPTLGLPASLLWSGGDDVFAFLRAATRAGI